MSIWNELGVEPTRERRAIKRAYAARLELTSADDQPEAFQALRHAYERALSMADGGDAGAGALPSQESHRRDARKPLPALALDHPLAVPLKLEVRLETDAEIAQQSAQLNPPGPRPVTQYFTRAAAAAPSASSEQAAQVAGMAHLLCERLHAIGPAARAAGLGDLLRERQWDTPAFAQQLEPALAAAIGADWEKHWPLVAPIGAHYRWQDAASGQLGGGSVAVLMQRAVARAWSAPILSLPPAHPARVALGMLAGELDESAATRDARNAAKAGAMRALVEQLKEAPAQALPHLVNPRTLAWWTRYLAQHDQLRDVEQRADMLMQAAAIEAETGRVPLLLRPIAGTGTGWRRIVTGALGAVIVLIVIRLFTQ